MFLLILLGVALLVFFSWNSRFIRIWRRDLRLAWLCFGASIELAHRSWQQTPLEKIFESVRCKEPGKACFIYGDEVWSFQDVEDYSNQVAHYFSTVRMLKEGDCVALFATSSPQYVCIWLGLAKIGCVTSFINSSIKGEALIHAIDAVTARLLVVSADLTHSLTKISTELKEKSIAWLILEERLPRHGEDGCFDDEVGRMPKGRVEGRRKLGTVKNAFTDKIGYIYTSGTTGLPKPCVISTRRMFTFALVIKYLAQLTRRDVIYCTLPLYHLSGGMIAVGQALLFGSTVVIRKKFSVSAFWSDIARHECTAFQYIGEMCRYLLKQPRNDLHGQTKSLRVMFGQGLRANIWQEFVNRFHISSVIETYGSTEGNVGLANVQGKVGAVGFTSSFTRLFRPQYIIKIDGVTGQPLRCPQGLCIQTKPGEVGELVGKISWNPFTHFDGYLDRRATDQKILSSVLRSGDRFFRTGDLMTADGDGYITFVDRTGDTFRWKGENVSTTEVENAITNSLPSCDVAVFGVDVPGMEGKAGMACLAGPPEAVDASSVAVLNGALKEALPVYARPVFLRIVPAVDVTETFKVTKTRLKEEAYSLASCSGHDIFYLDRKSDTYRPLSSAIRDELSQGIFSC